MFAMAAWPQTLSTIRAGHDLNTPISIIRFFLAGNLLSYIYLYSSHGFDAIIAVNYLLDTTSWCILLFYKVFRPKPQEELTP
jgi:hypothetical protein